MRPFSFLLAAVILLTLSAVSYGQPVDSPTLLTVVDSEHAVVDALSVITHAPTPVLQTHRVNIPSRHVHKTVYYTPRRKYSRPGRNGPCPWKQRDYGNTIESFLAAHAARLAEARARDRANDRR